MKPVYYSMVTLGLDLLKQATLYTSGDLCNKHFRQMTLLYGDQVSLKVQNIYFIYISYREYFLQAC